MIQGIRDRTIVVCTFDINHTEHYSMVRPDFARTRSLVETSNLLREIGEKVTLMICAPDLEGVKFECIERISAEFPDVDIVLLTERVSREGFAKAIETGIRGILPSFLSTRTLCTMLELIGLGEEIFLGAEAFD